MDIVSDNISIAAFPTVDGPVAPQPSISTSMFIFLNTWCTGLWPSKRGVR